MKSDAMMKKIEMMRKVIESSNGKIISIVFTKKNGEERKMLCRLGVTKYINPNAKTCCNGTTSTTSHIDYLVTVFDMQKEMYRNINLSTITYFKCGEVEINLK